MMRKKKIREKKKKKKEWHLSGWISWVRSADTQWCGKMSTSWTDGSWTHSKEYVYLNTSCLHSILNCSEVYCCSELQPPALDEVCASVTSKLARQGSEREKEYVTPVIPGHKRCVSLVRVTSFEEKETHHILFPLTPYFLLLLHFIRRHIDA